MSKDPSQPYSLARYTLEALKSRYEHWLGASSLLRVLKRKQNSKNGEKISPLLLIAAKLHDAANSKKQMSRELHRLACPVTDTAGHFPRSD